MTKSCLYLVFCLLTAGIFFSLPALVLASDFDDQSAAIFVYNRIGEDQYPSTNIRFEQFTAHIMELVAEDYNILPLQQIVDAFKNQTPLPDKTVAITFDGGHKSAFQYAIPLLEEHNIPYTVFFAPDKAEQNSPAYMNWQDLKKLQKSQLATLGLHPSVYTRMHGLSDEELSRHMNNAIALSREKLGRQPAFFAYPFGEYTEPHRQMVKETGFEAAFGQQSGIAHAGSDLWALPRFPMTEEYGDLSRFLMTASAKPLPVTDITPESPVISNNPPSIGMTLDESLEQDIDDLTCFVSGSAETQKEIIGTRRIELRVQTPFNQERIRINCTIPVYTDDGREPVWRWFGMLLSVPEDLQFQASSLDMQ